MLQMAWQKSLKNENKKYYVRALKMRLKPVTCCLSEYLFGSPV